MVAVVAAAAMVVVVSVVAVGGHLCQCTGNSACRKRRPQIQHKSFVPSCGPHGFDLNRGRAAVLMGMVLDQSFWLLWHSERNTKPLR